MDKTMHAEQKPYQWLAWVGTLMLILAASLASFVPHLEYHHWLYIVANGIWVIVGILWKERTVWVLNAGLTLVFVLGKFL